MNETGLIFLIDEIDLIRKGLNITDYFYLIKQKKAILNWILNERFIGKVKTD